MKTILELRRERESRTPIRKMITHLSHYYSDGGDTAISVKLVEQVVDKLNIDWYNAHLKILDVKSNHATFSLIIIEKLLNHGHHIDHILDNMIYAIDGDKIQSMTSNKAFLNVFKRSGNIYHEDFLTYDFKMKFDLIVGNPPYGKNANLAINFLNKAKSLSDNIHFVLPRTFRKISTLNRISKNLHLVHDETVPDEFFPGGIVTCYQHWVFKEELRPTIKTPRNHPDFEFVSKSDSFLNQIRMCSLVELVLLVLSKLRVMITMETNTIF